MNLIILFLLNYEKIVLLLTILSVKIILTEIIHNHYLRLNSLNIYTGPYKALFANVVHNVFDL